MSTLFDFKSWCETNGLKKGPTDLLTEEDLSTKEALVVISLCTESDVAKQEIMMTLGQRKLPLKAIATLRKDYPNEAQIDMARRLFQNCLLT